MQSTLIVLVLLLSAQLGERYPAQSTADETSQSAPASEGANQPASAVPAQSQEPQTASDNLFNETGDTDRALQSDSQTSEPPSQTAPGQSTTLPVEPAQPPVNPQRPVTAVPRVTDPAEILSGILDPPLDGRLQGTSLTLTQAIESSTDRQEQTERVITYWQLSEAVAKYYLAYKERTELTDLRKAITLPGSDWNSAHQNAEARVLLAGSRVRFAQEHLAQLMGNTSQGFAPLPGDVPFCGSYETRYDQIFLNRTSVLAESLDKLLPQSHEQLTRLALEIAAAREWMFHVSDNRSPQSDGGELLKAFELFAATRRMFVSAVNEYNEAIVRYTEIATPGTLETDRLVGMLIRTGGSQATTYDTEVRRAGAEESADPNDSSGIQPKGPGVSGWTPRSSRGERSILVPRS